MPMEALQETQPTRRRKRKSSKARAGSWSEYFRGREFARMVFLGMCALAVAYAAKFLWDARMATIGVYGVGAQDVRYVYSPPQAVEEGGRLYRYDDGKRVALARFGEDGLLRSFSCSAKGPAAAECDEVLDVGIGDSEEQVLLQLRATYSGDDKILHYDGLGLSLRMRRLKVQAIEVHRGSSFGGYFFRAVWRMIP
jgi:hypothetical protein